VEIVYRRSPGDIKHFRQELLLDGEDVKITLQHGDEPGPEPPRGAVLVWFTFPDRPHEVAAVYEADGRLRGYYANIVEPPRFDSPTSWQITDAFIDVWQPRGGEPEILDEEELREAEQAGWIDPAAAGRAREEAAQILERIRRRRWPPRVMRRWPPRVVRRWPLDGVPSLRLRRDEPGRYFANLVSTRVIAYGLYLLGAVSITSVAFAAFTDALVAPGAAQRVWLATLGAEAAVLLPFALGGWLPATAHARPSEAMQERTLLAAAAATGIAVLLLNRSELWRDLLVAVYGSLAFFLAVFGICRAWFDRAVPLAALAGLGLCAIALWVLV
jgi:hypothetical protein